MGFGRFLNPNQSRLRVWCMERRDRGRSASWVHSREMSSSAVFTGASIGGLLRFATFRDGNEVQKKLRMPI